MMQGVTYGLADFVTGGPILDLPVMEDATWAAQLNRGDALEVTIDLNDEDALALDLRSSSEPRKTVLFARTDEDFIVAWGVIDDDRQWDEDAQTLKLTAKGIEASWLGSSIIGPASALTAPLVIDGTANAALDTTLSGWSLGTIGKKLIEQRLAWPGAPTTPFVLPADEAGTHERTYLFSALKRIGPALNDLVNVENGPDFAFRAQRGPDGLSLLYVMEHGTEAEPRIGTHVGAWSLGGESPISELKISDSASDLGTAAWLSGGKTAGAVMMSRALNDDMLVAGYPPLDFVDTARNDVTVQGTLDAYARAAAAYAHGTVRSLSFSVRADARPSPLDGMRPGDTVTIVAPADHAWLVADIVVRITSLSGDVDGLSVKVGCEVVA